MKLSEVTCIIFLLLFRFKRSFLQASNGLLQRQLSGKLNYGSVDTPLPPRPSAPPTLANAGDQQQTVVSSTNPFVSTNPFRQEAVQPEAHDTYMHGSIEDRTYWKKPVDAPTSFNYAPIFCRRLEGSGDFFSVNRGFDESNNWLFDKSLYCLAQHLLRKCWLIFYSQSWKFI